jgi:hypothetical protein
LVNGINGGGGVSAVAGVQQPAGIGAGGIPPLAVVEEWECQIIIMANLAMAVDKAQFWWTK